MKLTIDCQITYPISTLHAHSALAALLSIAKIARTTRPLEALISEQFGLSMQQDYPIAAIVASADGLEVGSAYWLRADPVHLVLQRDSFSLAEPYPLLVEQAHSTLLLQSLNQHFKQDGLIFMMGQSGAWYLRSEERLEIKTSLPSEAASKNIHDYLPSGAMAPKIRAVINEVQMLLHEHAVNDVRESTGKLAVNSVWFSGGGVMPIAIKSAMPLVVADHVLYKGLAVWSSAARQTSQETPADFLMAINNNKEVRLQLKETQVLEDEWLSSILVALKNRTIHHLILNLGVAENTLTAVIKPFDVILGTCQFWRKPKAVLEYLQ